MVSREDCPSYFVPNVKTNFRAMLGSSLKVGDCCGLNLPRVYDR